MKHSELQLPSNKQGAVQAEPIRAATNVVVRVLVPEMRPRTLEGVLSDKYRQVIFLTNEINSIDPDQNGFIFRIFDTFPIARIWTSLHFILYLFLRHRKDFPLHEARDVLRNVNLRMRGREEVIPDRLIAFDEKLKQIDKTLSQLRDF